ANMIVSFGLRCRGDWARPAAIPRRAAGNDHDNVERRDVCSRTRERRVIPRASNVGWVKRPERSGGRVPTNDEQTIIVGGHGRSHTLAPLAHPTLPTRAHQSMVRIGGNHLETTPRYD